jgi:hypothetical protein
MLMLFGVGDGYGDGEASCSIVDRSNNNSSFRSLLTIKEGVELLRSNKRIEVDKLDLFE